MILGVYWYFDFPYELYSYDLFTYRKGLGGHADSPAELVTDVEVDNPDLVIDELRQLVAQHPDAFIYIYSFEKFLRIGTGGYAMHDFEFELIKTVETILKTHNAKPTVFHLVNVAELIKLSNDGISKNTRPGNKHFQLVGSSLMNYNAETFSFRFDCTVDALRKDEFLNELILKVELANIHVVYYRQKKCTDQYNLMIFFTNGRQGVGLTPKQHVAISTFEREMNLLIDKYEIQIGHIPGFDNYPKGEAIVLKMVDEEFILKP